MNRDNTICAIATPAGSGAIALIRLSGSDAWIIMQKIFHPKNKKISVSTILPNTAVFGSVINGDETVDEVMATFYKAPHSYTGEDVVEITCHGSLYIQQTLIQTLIKNGAAQATPGEFTMRAFLNGKMDLSQAEAVIDVINSESKAAHKLAMDQMRGGFSKEIAALRSQLLEIASLIELELDFSEEEVEFADRMKLNSLIEKIKAMIDRLVSSFQLGNVIKNGVPVAIVGKTNVGKSTLLNAFLNEEKAIVSDVHGTTRDTIEDVISIKGVAFRFIDTAGLRETADIVEKLGIERTYEKISKATIILQIIDARDEIADIKQQAHSIMTSPGQHLIIVINKADLADENKIAEIIQSLELSVPIIIISAKQRKNIQQLEQLLLESIDYKSTANDIMVTNTRHYEALQKASAAVKRAIDGITLQSPNDLIAMDIREILHYLGEISGEITTDEILGNIFRNFCIGK